MTNVNYITCMICGASKRELNGHIRIHGLVKSQYREMFPNSPMQCEDIRITKSAKIKASIKHRPPLSTETKQKMSESHKSHIAILKERIGEQVYQATRNRVCAEMRAKKGANYKHSEDTIEKMKGPRPKARVPKTEEHKQAIKLAAQTRKKRGPHNQETLEKMSDSAIRRLEKQLVDPHYAQKLYDTKPELDFQSWLENQQLNYQKQVVIKTNTGSYIYDFLVTDMNLLVEIDGEYWHRKTLKQISRDKFKERAALAMGYKMVRISDKDFRPEVIYQSSAEQQEHNARIMTERLQSLKKSDT